MEREQGPAHTTLNAWPTELKLGVWINPQEESSPSLPCWGWGQRAIEVETPGSKLLTRYSQAAHGFMESLAGVEECRRAGDWRDAGETDAMGPETDRGRWAGA